ncbi:MAG: protein kinase [Planctomycetales bacterium]|nr:protein kinase [Planctomycetales bacterium]
MAPFTCPSCRHPLSMDQLVNALRGPSPCCPICGEALPESARSHVEEGPTTSPWGRLAEPDAEPDQPFGGAATLDDTPSLVRDDETVDLPPTPVDLQTTVDAESIGAVETTVDLPATPSANEADSADEAHDTAEFDATVDIETTVDAESIGAIETTVDVPATPSANEADSADETHDTAEFKATVDVPRDEQSTIAEAAAAPTPRNAEVPAEPEATWIDPAPTAADASAIPTSATVRDPQTVAEGHGASNQATVSPATVSGTADSRILYQMPKMWASVDRESNPGATIRGEDRDETLQCNLVIQTRELRGGKAEQTFENADYQLIQQLGEGGMGVVYAARQASIDRTVAIKMLKPSGAQNEKQRGKFLSEAVVTGELDHPNIVPIYDLGTNSDGSLFYSMKRVEGTPWDDVIVEKSLTENLQILMKVADAVAFAHDKGVIHRDLKPENVMLGDYGEVLVMDWGLAVPFRSHDVRSAAGTPAYMAPEMAAGPYEAIGVRSDVYLLGAILFEILVGKPPHTGNTVMKCLMAAAKNEIRPHSATGELLEIAMWAMHATPQQRPGSVKEFQAAITAYLEHMESIDLANRSAEELAEAVSQRDYQGFSQALFGFRESLNFWPGNARATEGLAAGTLAYARLANEQGDYDLGISLLDPAEPAQQQLLTDIRAAKAERDARQHRLKNAKRAMLGLAVCLGVVITGAFFLVNGQRRIALQKKEEAESLKVIAERERNEAQQARDDEQQARMAAEIARKKEEQQREQAERAQQEEAKARQAEAMARHEAEQQREAALVAHREEVKARQQEAAARRNEQAARRQEEYEAYVARIGLAHAKIGENAFGQARRLLADCPAELRHWEWGRLMYLCDQGQSSLAAGAAIEAIALHESGEQRLLAVATRQGEVQVHDLGTRQIVARLPHRGAYVNAVAFSADGAQIATGSNSPDGNIQIWDWRGQRTTKQWQGHDDAVLSVAFAADGRLLTSSYDQTAKLWRDGELLRTLAGHTWWVWSARFSPDGRKVVTCGQDGLVYVWDAESGQRSAPFREHSGPVFTAVFSADGVHVASGGNDHTIRVWRDDALVPFDFKAAARGDEARPQTAHRTLQAHQSAVRDVRFDAQGRLVSCGHDNAVILWDVESGRRLTTLRGHDSWVRSCDVTADGRTAVSGGLDGEIKLWDIDGYREQQVVRGRTLSGHSDAVLGVDFAPDGERVVTASRDRTARQWSLVNGQLLNTYQQGHAYLTSQGVLLDNGRLLATAAVDNTTRIWDVATGAELQRLESTGRGAALAASRDGRWLLTGGAAGQAQLWNVADLTAASPRPQRVLGANEAQRGIRSTVTALAFSPDGSNIAVGEATGRVTLWTPDGQLLGRLGDSPAEGPTRRISGLAFARDELIVASEDQTVTRWRVSDRSELRSGLLRHPQSVTSLSVSLDGRVAATCDAAGAARVWELATGRLFRQLTGEQGPLANVSLRDDGAVLLAAEPEANVVRRWSLADAEGAAEVAFNLRGSGQVLWSVVCVGDGALVVGGDGASLWDPGAAQPKSVFRPHGAVASVHYSPAGDRIVTASWDRTARIWDAASGKVLQILGGNEGHQGFVNAAAFSPDGQRVVTASDDHTLGIWDVASGNRIGTLRGHRGRVLSARFTADGAHALSASMDGEAILWRLADGTMAARMAHEFGLRDAAISRDGRMLVTASEDGRARIWKLGGGAPQLTSTLSGHTAAVQAVALSPDGLRVLTGSADFLAKLWDARTGKEILTLHGHPREVNAVQFSPDGRHILSGSQDGTAIIWPTRPWQADPALAGR